MSIARLIEYELHKRSNAKPYYNTYIKSLINHKSYIGSNFGYKSATNYIISNCNNYQYVIWQNHVENEDDQIYGNDCNLFFISFKSLSTNCPSHFVIDFAIEDNYKGLQTNREICEYVSENVYINDKHFTDPWISYIWAPSHMCPIEFMVNFLSCVEDDNTFNVCWGVKREPFNRYNNPCTIICEKKCEYRIECVKQCDRSYQPWSLLKLSGFVLNSYYSVHANTLELPSILLEYLDQQRTSQIIEIEDESSDESSNED